MSVVGQELTTKRTDGATAGFFLGKVDRSGAKHRRNGDNGDNGHCGAVEFLWRMRPVRRERHRGSAEKKWPPSDSVPLVSFPLL